MATEIIRWCDAHMLTDERVVAAPHAVVLDGKTGTVDLCPEHAKALLAPLVDLLAPDPTTKGVGGRKAIPGDAPCLFCDETYRGSRLSSHVIKTHGQNFMAAYGSHCPLCDDGREFQSSASLGIHAKGVHNLDGCGELWAQVARDGDPHGRLAARRQAVEAARV